MVSTKTITMVMVSITIVMALLLVGCIKPIQYVNVSVPGPERIVYINRTIINQSITEPLQLECESITPVMECPKDDRIELIRRLKFLEGQQDKYFNGYNDSECDWELNKTTIELDQAMEELCDLNSSRC